MKSKFQRQPFNYLSTLIFNYFSRFIYLNIADILKLGKLDHSPSLNRQTFLHLYLSYSTWHKYSLTVISAISSDQNLFSYDLALMWSPF